MFVRFEPKSLAPACNDIDQKHTPPLRRESDGRPVYKHTARWGRLPSGFKAQPRRIYRIKDVGLVKRRVNNRALALDVLKIPVDTLSHNLFDLAKVELRKQPPDQPARPARARSLGCLSYGKHR